LDGSYQIDTDGRFGCILCDNVPFLPGGEPDRDLETAFGSLPSSQLG
jgi:hypothetical protein